MKSTGFALAGMLLLGVGGAILVGQGGAAAQEKQGKIKKVPITYSKPDSGAQMYKDYCAACHGMEGKGDGPAAGFLKTPPPDLQTLALHNDGKYPAEHVSTTLRLGTGTQAHGTTDMPIWGPVFRTQNDANVTEMRIHNLTEFIGSLQQK